MRGTAVDDTNKNAVATSIMPSFLRLFFLRLPTGRVSPEPLPVLAHFATCVALLLPLPLSRYLFAARLRFQLRCAQSQFPCGRSWLPERNGLHRTSVQRTNLSQYPDIMPFLFSCAFILAHPFDSVNAKLGILHNFVYLHN